MSYREGRNTPQASLYQSYSANPSNVDRIRRALTNLYGPATDGPLPSSRRGPNDGIARWREIDRGTGMALFRVNSVIARHLDAVCPRRIVSLDFIRELTVAQLELFIDVSVLGDGSTSPSGQIVVTQKNPAALNALEMAAILAGRRVRRYQRDTEGFTVHTQHVLDIGRSSVCDFQHGGISNEGYTGTIWCPTTSNGTWLARHKGRAFFTGNSAWAVSDEERRITVQPDVEILCWIVTHMILHPALRDAGMPEAEVQAHGVWYDLSEAAVRSNQQEDARQSHDRLVISDAALVRVSGFTDDDVPDEMDRIRQLGVKIGDPYLAVLGTKAEDEIDWSKVGLNRARRSGPLASSPADPSPVGPGNGNPGSPDDIDSDTPRSERPD